MKQRLIAIEAFLNKLNPVQFVLVFVILMIVACIPVQLILGDTDIGGPTSIRSLGWVSIFVAVFFAPIVETLLFQGFIINQVLKYTKGNRSIAVFFSSVLFGLAHWYSVGYVFIAFSMGIVLGIARVIKEKHAIRYVIAIHAVKNLIALLAIAYL